MCAALARANTPEAATRKLAIKTLWRCAGRASEPGQLNYEGMEWNALGDCLVVQAPQEKVSKVKYVPFLAGSNRHTCWMVDYGDELVLQRGMQEYRSDEKMLLIPELKGDNVGTKIGNYIKGLQPSGRKGAIKHYAPFAVPSLPAQPSAAGMRPGASDTMALAIPAEFAVHMTGHDLSKSCGSIFIYLDTRFALLVPGALALADWPPYPYGQIGRGPRSPSLTALIDTKRTDGTPLALVADLEIFIDALFSLHDHSHPALFQDGPLRPLMHATLATLIMYYKERFDAGEMHLVLTHMREAFSKSMGSLDESHQVLVEWSKIIRQQFDVNNLHLTARHAHDNSAQIVTAIQHLSSAQERLQVLLSEVAVRQIRIETGQESIIAKLDGLLRRSASASEPAATSELLDSAPPEPVRYATGTPGVHSPRPTARLPTLPQLPQPGQGARGAAAGTYDLKVGAGQFYLDCIELKGNIPALKDDKRKSDAKKVLTAFQAMTTAEEREVLFTVPRDLAVMAPLVNRLTSLLVARIKESYISNKLQCPPAFGTGKVLVNTFVENLRKSNLVVDRGNFMTWRTARTAGAGGSSSSDAGGKRAATPTGDDTGEPSAKAPRRSPRPLGPVGREDSGASSSAEEEEEEEEEEEVWTRSGDEES